MGMMKVLHNLVTHEHGSPDDQCTLLVKVTKTTISANPVETHTLEVSRSEIENVCHRFRDADDAFEVTVFQRIYHATKEPAPVVAIDDAAASALANAALGAMKL